MKLTIHRGTDQIGGCITEYELNGWKLFVDFGSQLPGSPGCGQPFRIEGLNCGDTSKSALLITHYHGDHIGQLAEADPAIPIYMGRIARDIFCKFQRRLTSIVGEPGERAKFILKRCKKAHTFLDREKFSFGPFYIIPVRMNHSAYDAYGFIIENKGNDRDKVFHTGDFRSYGSYCTQVCDLIPTLPAVKAIVCEGTNIERKDNPAETEYSIERRFETLFKEYKYNVVFVSSTNIDRLVGICRAAAAADRPMLMDRYQSDIMKSVIGKDDWRRFAALRKVLKYAPASMGSLTFDFTGKIQRLVNWKGCVLLARSSPQFTSLIERFSRFKTRKYFSMWNGYLDPDKPAFNADLAIAVGEDYEYLHTSGHADIHTLEQFFSHLDADVIIPMHTSNPAKFLEKFPDRNWQIRLLKDGETTIV